MISKRLKKKIRKKMDVTNIIIGSAAVIVSFCIVNIGGTVGNQSNPSVKSDDLVYSANRIADAFELYNQKRFTP